MGLDSVEILMKIENTFGIQIPNWEAEKILTVGDFYEAVWRHLSGKYSDKCKSQALFYRLRKLFQVRFNIHPSAILLSTSPNNIFPEIQRRKSYHDFSFATGLELPSLVLSKGWLSFLNISGLVMIGGGLVFAVIMIFVFHQSKWVLLIPVAGIVLTILLSKLLNIKRTIIEAQTMRSFTEQVLALNYASFIVDEGTNRIEVEAVINHIIADMAGLELEEITPEKKIADDLGID